MLTGNAMASSINDPLTEAEGRFQALTTYRATIHSSHAADGERQVIRYAYRKPGWIRMEFVQPHRGLVLIYDPGMRKVRLWPRGVNHIPVLSFNPDNPLIRSRSGQRVDHSDVGALLANLMQLRASGSVTPLRETDHAARPALGLNIIGGAGVAVAGVHQYRVLLAHDSLFPLKVESFDAGGNLIETVEMSDVEIEVAFPENFFTP
jgi:outer membrane lipoprotein-sorting protein